MIKLHHKYLLNKINLIIWIVVIVIMTIFEMLIAFSLGNHPLLNITKQMILEEYINSSIIFARMIMVLWSIYLFGFCFYKEGDNYRVLTITKVSGGNYYLSKMIAIFLEEAKMLGVIFVIQFFIGSFFTKWYYLKIDMLICYGKIYLISLIYGLLSVVFVSLFKNLYAIIITSVLYLLSEILIVEEINQNVLTFIQLFFPNKVSFQASIDIIHLFLLIIFYLVAGYRISRYKKE